MPAQCVLVVEKDSVFRRLVDDGFVDRLPCVLITGCGFPDLATRCLVARVVDALNIRCHCLTDYNPHGLALMLAYQQGTANLSLERGCCCPSIRWLGLRAAHVRRASSMGHDDSHAGGSGDTGEDGDFDCGVGSGSSLGTSRYSTSSQSTCGGVLSTSGGWGERVRPLPDESFQAFSQRDRSVVAGLAKRPAVERSAVLAREVSQMSDNAYKVEIEALYCHGFEYLSHFIEAQILASEEVWGDGDDDDGERGIEGRPIAWCESVGSRDAVQGHSHSCYVRDDHDDDGNEDEDSQLAVALEQGEICDEEHEMNGQPRWPSKVWDDMDEDERWLLEEPEEW